MKWAHACAVYARLFNVLSCISWGLCSTIIWSCRHFYITSCWYKHAKVVTLVNGFHKNIYLVGYNTNITHLKLILIWWNLTKSNNHRLMVACFYNDWFGFSLPASLIIKMQLCRAESLSVVYQSSTKWVNDTVLPNLRWCGAH